MWALYSRNAVLCPTSKRDGRRGRRVPFSGESMYGRILEIDHRQQETDRGTHAVDERPIQCSGVEIGDQCIPHYTLIDRNGNMSQKSATRPSDKAKLTEEIKDLSQRHH